MYKGMVNRFYLFGGKDEMSASLIQGITLAGVFFDEVALMPRSFVEQSLARCSVEGSKFWFNCNPEYPGHWFYCEWIKKCKMKNALYLHFEMEDNPSLSKGMIHRYQSLYTGAFYERFVRVGGLQQQVQFIHLWIRIMLTVMFLRLSLVNMQFLVTMVR